MTPALAELRAMEEAGVPLAVGIAWIEPLPLGDLRMNDLRIGGTRSDAQTMNLDFDASSGNVFAIVRWGSTTGTSAWDAEHLDRRRPSPGSSRIRMPVRSG